MIRNNLASAHLFRGNEQKALSLFEKTVGPAGSYNNLGFLYLTQGKYKKAEESFEKALELNPTFYVKARKNLDYLKELKEKSGE